MSTTNDPPAPIRTSGEVRLQAEVDEGIARGSDAEHCSRWPAEVNGEGHAMESSSPAGTAMWVRRCSFCGWIDGADLEAQRLESIAAALVAGGGAVWPIAYGDGIAEGRRQAAAEIEAARTEDGRMGPDHDNEDQDTERLTLLP